MALDAIGVIFTAKDLASASISGLESKFKSLDSTTETMAQNFGKNMGLVTAGLGLVGGGLLGFIALDSFADSAISFESSLVKLGSVSSATADDMEKLEKKALALGIAFEFSPDEAVQGMRELASVGFNTGQILSGIDDTLLFASASQGQINISTAAQTMAGAIRGFGLEITESGRVVDVLTKATSISALKFDELGLTLGNTAADANIANQSFETTVATLGALRNTGLTSLRASEKLRIGLKNLIEPDAIKAAKDLGFEIRGSDGKLRQLDDIVRDLTPKLATMGQVQKEQAIASFFGQEGLSVFNAVANATFETVKDGNKVILQGADALSAMREQLDQAGGTAKDFQADFLSSVEGIQTLLSGTLDTFKIALGKPLLGIIGRATKALTDFLNIFLTFFIEFPIAADIFTGIVAGLSAFAVAIGTIVAMKGAVGLFSLAMGALGITLGPILLIIAKVALAVGFLVAAFLLVRKAIQTNFAGIGDIFQDIFDKGIALFRGIVGFLTKGEISEEVQAELERTGIGEWIDFILRNFVRIKAFGKGVMEGVSSAVQELLTQVNSIKAAFATLFSRITELAMPVIQMIDNIFGTNYTESLVNAQNAGVTFGNALVAVFSGVLTIIEFIVNNVTLFIDLLTAVGQTIGLLFAAAFEPGISLMDEFGSILETLQTKLVENPIVKFALEKIGIDTAKPEAAQTEGVKPQAERPGSPLALAPEFLGAQVGATNRGNEALFGGIEELAKGGEDQTIKNYVVLDSRVVAESTNRVNKRMAKRAGGQE